MLRRRATSSCNEADIRNPFSFAVWIGVVAFLGVEILRIVTGLAPPLDGTFDGADSYMRLVRVLECRGACPDGLLLRSNAPFGEILHWPYLEDWLLLAISLPFRVLLPARESVIAAAYLWGPLLSVALVYALVRIGARVIPSNALWLIGLLLATQLWALLGFAPHGVDHHGFVTLLFVLMVAAAAPALCGDEHTTRAAVGAGLALGVGVWESIEILAAAVPLVGVLGVDWIVRGRPESARFQRTMFSVATGVLFFALLIDGPVPHSFAAEYDRFSIVHVLLFALAAGFWWLMVAVPSRALVRRALFATLGMLAVFGLTIAVFPLFARGPLTAVPSDLFTTWIAPTTEFMPARLHSAVWQALTIGPLIVTMPVCAYFALRGERRARLLWGFLFAAFLWFGTLAAFQQIRWTYYLHALYPIPLTALLAAGLRAMRRGWPPRLVPAGQVLLVLLFLSAPLVTLAALSPPRSTSATSSAPCSGAEVIAAIHGLPQSHGNVILADVFLGPEILYRTDHDVVATPYHRNIDGTRDSHTIMRTTDFTEARRLITARGIRLIAVCRGAAWFPHVEPDAAGSFHAALQNDNAPDWIRPVSPNDQGRVVMWQVGY